MSTTGGFAHPALFYRDAAEYLFGTVPYLEHGLEAGEAVAVAVPGPNLALIRDALGERAAQVDLIDMTRAGRNPGHIIAGVLRAFADAHPGRPARIIGEPIWPGRTATEYPACVQHEALINLAFVGRPVSILCPYDSTRLDPDVLSDAARTHPVVIDSSGARRCTEYAPHQVVEAYNVPLPRPAGQSMTNFLFSEASLAQVQAYAIARSIRLGLPPSRAEDVEIVVRELTTNSVRHGGGSGSLSVWSAQGHVVCQIRDAGTITDPLFGRRPVSADYPAGAGLLRVNQLADLVRTYTAAGRVETCAYFRLPVPGSQ